VTTSEAPDTSETRFGTLTIRYDERVLRPRPWTVLQSTWAADLLPGLPAGPVLELCCGAGQIGLLATAGTDRDVVLVDGDAAACSYARHNADTAAAAGLGPRGTVEVRPGLLEDALDVDERFALVLADPPWVRSDETGAHPEDPSTAIDGGPDGLDVARGCLEVIDRHLLPGGAAIVQVGDTAQVAGLAAYAEQAGLALAVTDSRTADGGALALLERS
jgi:release factor glutamine methyltransferase